MEELSVSWDEFPGASGYIIRWKSEDSQEFDHEMTVTGESTTSYTITGLDPEIKYVVRVMATGTENLPSEATGAPRAKDISGPPLTQDQRRQQGCGACAIGSDVPGEVSQSALLNLLLVMSVLLFASKRGRTRPGSA